MAKQLDDVASEALKMPRESRAKLAEALAESLGGDSPGDIDQAWSAEIRRRLDDLRSGRTKPVPWSQVRRRIRAALRS